jgi:hypothetical protein
MVVACWCWAAARRRSGVGVGEGDAVLLVPNSVSTARGPATEGGTKAEVASTTFELFVVVSVLLLVEALACVGGGATDNDMRVCCGCLVRTE